MIILIVGLLLGLTLAAIGYMCLPKFGRQARGERLKRMEQSVNYREGQFFNQELTPQLTSDKGRVRTMFDFVFEKRDRNRPQDPIPVVKTDLKVLDKGAELFVWFGHSSYLIQSSGLRMLVDPVFADAAPVSFLNKPFEGTAVYSADDMPDIDYLIITHDHWDHLDYATVVELRSRVKHVVCPLGVGEHLEYWGYTLDQIVEMDWNESYRSDCGLAIHCLPSRHFSGRTFRPNRTLWASFMLVTPSQTIYVSGDSGYGIHYRQIASRFPSIDLAFMENGQYNQDWRYIHLMPEDLKRAVEELNPKRVMVGHNSKYALAKHPWDDPLEKAASISSAVMPMIGEVVCSGDSLGGKSRWWESID